MDLRKKQETPPTDALDSEAPTIEQLESALAAERYKRRYRQTMRNVIFILITAAAVSILIATLVLPVFRIYGSSMAPTLTEGNMIVAIRTDNLKQGDLVAFYYNNKILVKRVIATSGDWVDIDSEGNVYVNDELLDEPYVQQKALGECDITLPYQVPDERIFVMGDHRDVSIDSRSTAIGGIAGEQIAGKIVLRIWPLNEIGIVE